MRNFQYLLGRLRLPSLKRANRKRDAVKHNVGYASTTNHLTPDTSGTVTTSQSGIDLTTIRMHFGGFPFFPHGLFLLHNLQQLIIAVPRRYIFCVTRGANVAFASSASPVG